LSIACRGALERECLSSVGSEATLLIPAVSPEESGGFALDHALEVVDRETFDVVISDVVMDGMSGLALLDRLKRTHPALPVVVITAAGGVCELHRARGRARCRRDDRRESALVGSEHRAHTTGQWRACADVGVPERDALAQATEPRLR